MQVECLTFIDADTEKHKDSQTRPALQPEDDSGNGSDQALTSGVEGSDAENLQHRANATRETLASVNQQFPVYNGLPVTKFFFKISF